MLHWLLYSTIVHVFSHVIQKEPKSAVNAQIKRRSIFFLDDRFPVLQLKLLYVCIRFIYAFVSLSSWSIT